MTDLPLFSYLLPQGSIVAKRISLFEQRDSFPHNPSILTGEGEVREQGGVEGRGRGGFAPDYEVDDAYHGRGMGELGDGGQVAGQFRRRVGPGHRLGQLLQPTDD